MPHKSPFPLLSSPATGISPGFCSNGNILEYFRAEVEEIKYIVMEYVEKLPLPFITYSAEE